MQGSRKQKRTSGQLSGARSTRGRYAPRRHARGAGAAFKSGRLPGDPVESVPTDDGFFDNANDIVYTHDLTGRLTSINRAAERLTGYSRAEALTMNLSQVLAPEYVEPVRRMLAPESLGNGPVLHEVEILTKDGTRLPLELSTRLIFKAGKPIGVQGIARNITERRQIQEALRRRADEFEALYETAHDLATPQDLTLLLEIIVERATALLSASSGTLSLYDASTRYLRLVVSKNFPASLGMRVKLGEGISGRVAETRQPIVVDDYGESEYQLPQYEGIGIRASLQVPMDFAGELLGVVGVHEIGASRRTFSQEDLRLLRLFAAQAASAVHNASLLAASTQQAERLALLNRVARAVSSTLDLNELLGVVHRQVTSVIPVDAFFIALYDSETDELDYRVRVDEGVFEPMERRPLRPGVTHSVITEKRPILIRDYEQEQDHLPPVNVWGTMKVPASWLSVPMLSGEKVVGVISVQAYSPNVYGEAEREILSTIADTVAVAVENARLFEATKEQAQRDSLTGALNHGAFIAELHAARARDPRLALIMLDLDGFKRYNDTYGHVVGDQVLLETVQAIRAHIKRADFVGRWGGEEFGIALEGANAEQAVKVAERIRATLAQAHMRNREGNPIPPPTASQGIAALPGAALDIDGLIDCADRALYRAKALGRDQITSAESC